MDQQWGYVKGCKKWGLHSVCKEFFSATRRGLVEVDTSCQSAACGYVCRHYDIGSQSSLWVWQRGWGLRAGSGGCGERVRATEAQAK
jgi:hypothetical protein